VFKAEHIGTHGGPLGIYICKDSRKRDKSIEQFIAHEKQMRLDRLETYRVFAYELTRESEN